MLPVLPLPHLIFGAGSLATISSELSLFNVHRPLLMSDRGLERAGVCSRALQVLPTSTVSYFDIAENPSAHDVDQAYLAYSDGACDGVIALGGGSVIDAAKIVAALASNIEINTADLLGKPHLIGLAPAPLIAIPTTVGTGSESSPVSAIHTHPGGPVIGTRSPRLVPRAVLCDPDLVRSLPAKLIAATGIDALTHCIEGFLANPPNPVIDALALDGMGRAFFNIRDAMQPDGDAARASMMAAAFMGGAAIHKGLGPVHAIALSCGDQGLHHGSLVAAALPRTIKLVSQHLLDKTAKIASVLGLSGSAALPGALQELVRSIGLPSSLTEAGYRAKDVSSLVELVVASPFNRSSPYVPTSGEYRNLIDQLLA